MSSEPLRAFIKDALVFLFFIVFHVDFFIEDTEMVVKILMNVF